MGVRRLVRSLFTKGSDIPKSNFPNTDEFIITELDKLIFYHDILRNDETAIVDYDEKFIYFFDENFPKIISKMLNAEIYGDENENEGVSEEEAWEALSKNSFRRLLVNREYVTAIDIYWPRFRSIGYDETIVISTYPIKRKVPFAFLGSNSVIELDLLPIVKLYPNCLDKDELLKRIKKRYRKEWEETFGNWNEKFGNKKPSYIT
jgi:hypothetical protein